jgi:polysaccharide deacetylase family sporulation protein PdaB
MRVFVLDPRRVRIAIVLLVLLVAAYPYRGHFFAAGERVLAVAGYPRKLPIYYVATEEKKVAISFDAAWGADQTEGLLATLRKHNIKTTFFLVGFWVKKHPDMVKRIAEEGHEIGNHTANHPHLNALGKEEIKEELASVHRQIKELTGKEANLFRPPFGEYSNKVIEAAEELGYYTIQWSIDSLDWKDVSSSYIIDRVTGQIHPGAIVLFHNAAVSTPGALEPIIEKLHADGYKIVPIGELLHKGEFFVDHDGAMKPKPKPPGLDQPGQPEGNQPGSPNSGENSKKLAPTKKKGK